MGVIIRYQQLILNEKNAKPVCCLSVILWYWLC